MDHLRPFDPQADVAQPFDEGAFGEVYRAEVGRCTATMVRVLGDIDLAEDAVAEAFAIAARRWPQTGIPPNPGGWITTTARNRGIDHVRREAKRPQRHRAAHHLATIHTDSPEPPVIDELGDADVVADDQLRLIFMCCHPALAPDTQVALTLRLLGGLQTHEIVRAFLVPEATMAQRLVRAKRKIRHNNIPYRIPEAHELPDRLGPVLATVYLVYNEGHTATSGPNLVRTELATEAIRLARLLTDLMPDEPEVVGLLAFLLLTEARRPARTDVDGLPVRLGDQDRGHWDRVLIDEGHRLVRACLRRNQPGIYQLQAAIAAVHADAPTADETDWAQIVALYDQLVHLRPTPIIALNRAIAIAELNGPEAGLAAVDETGAALDDYHLFHAARAELLARSDRIDDALAAYRRALDLVANDRERRFLTDQRDRVSEQ